MRTQKLISALMAAIFATSGVLATAITANADSDRDNKGKNDRREDRRDDRRDYRQDYRRDDRREDRRGDRREYRQDYRRDYRYDNRWDYRPPARYYRPAPVVIVPPRQRYGNVIIVKPYNHYPRYKRIYSDDHFWGWLAFTAITLKLLDNLNEQQQREHEAALLRATQVPLGNSVIWSQGHASGSVTPVWEGPSNTGMYCREYRHDVTIGGKTESAYGTACRQPDGSWEIVE